MLFHFLKVRFYPRDFFFNFDFFLAAFIFFLAVSGSQQKWAKGIEISIFPLHPPLSASHTRVAFVWVQCFLSVPGMPEPGLFWLNPVHSQAKRRKGQQLEGAQKPTAPVHTASQFCLHPASQPGPQGTCFPNTWSFEGSSSLSKFATKCCTSVQALTFGLSLVC